MKKNRSFSTNELMMTVAGLFEVLFIWVGYAMIRYGVSGFIIAESFTVGFFIFVFPMFYEFYLIDKLNGYKRLVFKVVSLIFPVVILIIDAFVIPQIMHTKFILRDLFLDLLILGLILYILQYASFVYKTLGDRAIWAFYSGKYIKPVIENKAVMFIDIKSSTSIAEKIGHQQFLSLLNDFFYMISDSISAFNGEIYKYVGDEVIILWEYKSLLDNKPVDFFKEISNIVSENQGLFIERYGITEMNFKAGLHAGTVVVGELGKFHKEIAFIGDTLNTTARLEGLCNKEGCRLIFTEDYIKLVKKPYEASFKYKSIGASRLRGREENIKLYCLK